MKSMTIRGIDPALEKRIKQESEQEGKSINQVVIDSLKKFYGLEKRKKFTRIYRDMDNLFGRWPEEDFKRIQGRIDSQRKIDPELWNE